MQVNLQAIVNAPNTNQLALPTQQNNVRPQRRKSFFFRKQDQFQDFVQTLRLETTLSSLMIDRVSSLVQKYFKLLPQHKKSQNEAQTLLKYNTRLIQTIDKFRQHQKKILDRLHRLEQINIKYIKEVCAMKNKQFNKSDIKSIQSIMETFNINEWKFQPDIQIVKEVPMSCQQKLLKITRRFLVPFKKQDLQKIQTQLVLEKQAHQHELANPRRNWLNTLKQKTIAYETQLQKGVSMNNVFDLFELRKDIEDSIQEIDMMSQKTPRLSSQQILFVRQIRKFYADITTMPQSGFIQILKNQKQIQKKLQEQKLHVIETYETLFETLVDERNSQEQKNKYLSNRIQENQKQLSETKKKLIKLTSDLEMRQIKSSIKRMNSINNASIIQEENAFEEENKKLRKLKIVYEKDLESVREQCQELKREIVKLKAEIAQKDQKLMMKQVDIEEVFVEIPVPIFITNDLIVSNHQILKKSNFDKKGSMKIQKQFIQAQFMKKSSLPMYNYNQLPKKSDDGNSSNPLNKKQLIKSEQNCDQPDKSNNTYKGSQFDPMNIDELQEETEMYVDTKKNKKRHQRQIKEVEDKVEHLYPQLTVNSDKKSNNLFIGMKSGQKVQPFHSEKLLPAEQQESDDQADQEIDKIKTKNSKTGQSGKQTSYKNKQQNRKQTDKTIVKEEQKQGKLKKQQQIIKQQNKEKSLEGIKNMLPGFRQNSVNNPNNSNNQVNKKNESISKTNQEQTTKNLTNNNQSEMKQLKNPPQLFDPHITPPKKSTSKSNQLIDQKQKNNEAKSSKNTFSKQPQANQPANLFSFILGGVGANQNTNTQPNNKQKPTIKQASEKSHVPQIKINKPTQQNKNHQTPIEMTESESTYFNYYQLPQQKKKQMLKQSNQATKKMKSSQMKRKEIQKTEINKNVQEKQSKDDMRNLMKNEDKSQVQQTGDMKRKEIEKFSPRSKRFPDSINKRQLRQQNMEENAIIQPINLRLDTFQSNVQSDMMQSPKSINTIKILQMMFQAALTSKKTQPAVQLPQPQLTSQVATISEQLKQIKANVYKPVEQSSQQKRKLKTIKQATKQMHGLFNETLKKKLQKSGINFPVQIQVKIRQTFTQTVPEQRKIYEDITKKMEESKIKAQENCKKTTVILEKYSDLLQRKDREVSHLQRMMTLFSVESYELHQKFKELQNRLDKAMEIIMISHRAIRKLFDAMLQCVKKKPEEIIKMISKKIRTVKKVIKQSRFDKKNQISLQKHSSNGADNRSSDHQNSGREGEMFMEEDKIKEEKSEGQEDEVKSQEEEQNQRAWFRDIIQINAEPCSNLLPQINTFFTFSFNDIPSSLNRDYIQQFKSRYYQTKQYVQKNKDTDQQQLYLKYRQALKCVQQQQRKTKNYELQYQNFINEITEDETLNSEIQMKNQIFYLRKEIKRLQQDMEENQLDYEKSMKGQIMESRKLSELLLATIREHVDLQNKQEQF